MSSCGLYFRVDESGGPEASGGLPRRQRSPASSAWSVQAILKQRNGVGNGFKEAGHPASFFFKGVFLKESLHLEAFSHSFLGTSTGL